jgi:hypothetical protein
LRQRAGELHTSAMDYRHLVAIFNKFSNGLSAGVKDFLIL